MGFLTEVGAGRRRFYRWLGVAALAWLCLWPCEPVESSLRRQSPRAAHSTGRRRVPVVLIGPRGGLSLDGRQAGTVERPGRLTKALKSIFRRHREESPHSRAVIIRAPAGLHYAAVARVVKAAKRAGAEPIRFVSDEGQLGEALRGFENPPATQRPADAQAADPALPTGMLDPSRDPAILKESSIVVVLAPDGNLYLGRRLVPEGELEAAVRSLTAGLPEADRIVYIRAHLDATYAQVVRVIDTVRKAGVNQIGLVAERWPQK